MAKLIHLGDGVVIREFVLDKELLTIGRTNQNDVQIESKSTSSKHARIAIIGNDFFLEDLGSTNGTLVNGTPIKKHCLQNYDLIEIGSHKFKFISDAAPGADQPTDSNFEKTMLLRVPKAAPRAPPQQQQKQEQEQKQGLFAKLTSWFKSL